MAEDQELEPALVANKIASFEVQYMEAIRKHSSGRRDKKVEPRKVEKKSVEGSSEFNILPDLMSNERHKRSAG